MPDNQRESLANRHALVDDLGMLPDLVERLRRLPRLDPKTRFASAIRCKICSNPAPFFDAVDFLRCAGGYPFGSSGILVPYHRCDVCGFLFTSFFDGWTPLAFRQFVYNDDYIVVDPGYVGDRSVRTADHFARLLAPAHASRILDWGAGSGTFASSMAERGFVVESYDPFSAPAKPTGKFQIIVCVEVIEHAPDPLRAFQEMAEYLTDDGMIILGEALQPDDIGAIRCSWWYVAPRNGHCSTFDRRTMAVIANRLGLVFRSRHPGALHVLYADRPGVCRDIAERIGPAIAHFRLGSPGKSAPGWHPVVRPEGLPAFQWSTSPEVKWDIVLSPGPKRTVIIDLPFLQLVPPDFATRCELLLGERVVPLHLHERMIVGELSDVDAGSYSVTLHTAPPLSARPPDDKRVLGIALRV